MSTWAEVIAHMSRAELPIESQDAIFVTGGLRALDSAADRIDKVGQPVDVCCTFATA